MTKLEAVNIMLAAIQETPVQSLDSGLVDAESAEAMLDRTIIEFLTKGWTVNTERNLRLSPDVDGKINLPANTLRIDTVGVSEDLDLVPRNDSGTKRLWDKTEQTFVIDQAVYVDLVTSEEFDNLPFDYQSYIAYLAAEKFQISTIGSVALDKYARTQKQEAWASILDAEADQEDDNILQDSESVRLAAWRNNPRALR